MKYRLTHYNYLAWQIEELAEPGKDAKSQEPYWRTIKYPGSLPFAVSGLLDLALGAITVESIEELTAAVKDAENRIMAEIENMIVERKKT